MIYRRSKYIITESGHAIVFPDTIEHVTFKSFNPIAAGFVSFGSAQDNWKAECKCYGKSISLGLESRKQIDTEIVSRQILNNETEI